MLIRARILAEPGPGEAQAWEQKFLASFLQKKAFLDL